MHPPPQYIIDMRKNVFIVLMICLTGCLSAQCIAYYQGEKTNKKAYEPQMIRIFESEQEGKLLVVEPEFNPAHITKSIKVRLCDMDWTDETVVKIPDTKRYTIESAFRNDDKLHLLLGFEDRDFIKLRHVAIDVHSLAVVADEFIVNHEYTAAQNGVVWAATSPDGTKHCAVLRLWSDNGGNYVAGAQAFLFDNDMKILWKKDLKVPEINQVIVTDGGEVVTSAMGYVEDNENEAIVLFNLADPNGTAAAELNTHADLNMMVLLNYSDGKVVFTALDGEGDADRAKASFRPGYVIGSRKYSGVRAISFYIPTNHLVAEHRHPFSLDDIRCFNNDDADSRVDTTTDNLSFLDKCATPQGGAVIYHRAWKLEKRDMRTGGQGGSTAHSLGMIVFQVDMDGNFTNVTPIRQHNQNADSPKVGADMFLYKGKLYVVTNESEHESDEYTPSIPAKRSPSLIKANTGLSIYAIAPAGTVKKQMLEKERKALLYSPLYEGKGGKFYFLSGGWFPNLSSITIP